MAGHVPRQAHCSEYTPPIDTAIMVVIMLAVMLLPGNMPLLHVLRLVQPGALLPRHDTVRLGTILDVVHMLLPSRQAACFTLRQAA